MNTDTRSAPGESSALSAKYGNLPDLDITAPDVYETASDEPRHTSRRKTHQRVDGDAAGDSESASDSEDASSSRKHNGGSTTADANIDSNPFSRANAASRFGRATDLDSTRTDFSGKVRSARVRKTVRGSTRSNDAGFETDIYSMEYQRQESAVDRLRRLKYEAGLLEEEFASQSTSNRDDPLAKSIERLSPQHMATQLQELQARLAQIDTMATADADRGGEGRSQDLSILVQRLSQPSASIAKQHMASERVDGVPSDDASTITVLLDARLTELEGVLGLHEAVADEAEPVPRPLLSTLTRLESQMYLLSQPRHLDTISRRVKVLVTELDRIRDGRKAAIVQPDSNMTSSNMSAPGTAKVSLTSSDVTQLGHLFQVSKRLDPLLPIVSPVLGRLQALSELHASAAQFNDTVNVIQDQTDTQRQHMDEMNELLAKMESNVTQNHSTMQANLENLRTRLTDVQNTLQSLQR